MPMFTVRQGKRYRAEISLGFFERWAGNDTIAGKLQEAGFTEVSVIGEGATRTAMGLWPAADTSADMPSQIVAVNEIAPATTQTASAAGGESSGGG